MNSKKADLPITILVIGVVFVCGLAIFSFYNAAKNFESDFNSVWMMQEMNSIEKMNSFYLEVEDVENIKPKIGEEFRNGDFVYTLETFNGNCYFNGNYTVREWGLEGIIPIKKTIKKAFISYRVNANLC